jgi:DNA-binding IclR family transcriptional regulator
MTTVTGDEYVAEGVLAKSVRVLDAFTPDDEALTFTELLTRTRLARATLHRIAGDLVAARLLDRGDGGRYRLGRHLFELGLRASFERSLLEVATPYLEDLYERTHETVHLGVRDGREVVYVAKVGGHKQAASPSRLGGRMPLHATAIGKVLLAFAPVDLRHEVLAHELRRCAPRTLTSPGALRRQLHHVVETGVAYEFEESAVGLVCVAAPVLDTDGAPVAAISIAGPVTRFRPQRHADSVRAAADGVAATLARSSVLLVGRREFR